MELIGESCGYILYKNSDGLIEGFKKTGNRIVNQANVGTGLAHITTNCTTIEQFEELMNKPKPAKIKPDHPKLFDDTIQ